MKQVNASALTVTSANPREALGARRMLEGVDQDLTGADTTTNSERIYRYYRAYAPTSAIYKGSVVSFYHGDLAHTVTAEVDADRGDSRWTAGVACATTANGSCGWFQVQGYCASVLTDDSVNISNELTNLGTAAGQASSSTYLYVTTNCPHAFGLALTTDRTYTSATAADCTAMLFIE